MENTPDLSNNDTSATITPPHKSISRWVVVIITILAVLGYFISFYAFNLWPFESLLPSLPQMSPPTTLAPYPTDQPDLSNWQTYRNEEYGLEFKYPENWIVFDGDNSIDVGHKDGLSLGFSIIDKTKAARTIELSKDSLKDAGLVGGKPASFDCRTGGCDDSDLARTIIIFDALIKDQVLFIQYNKNNEFTIVNQILSTFKFLDSK